MTRIVALSVNVDADGAERWEFAPPGPAGSAPLLLDDGVIGWFDLAFTPRLCELLVHPKVAGRWTDSWSEGRPDGIGEDHALEIPWSDPAGWLAYVQFHRTMPWETDCHGLWAVDALSLADELSAQGLPFAGQAEHEAPEAAACLTRIFEAGIFSPGEPDDVELGRLLGRASHHLNPFDPVSASVRNTVVALGEPSDFDAIAMWLARVPPAFTTASRARSGVVSREPQARSCEIVPTRLGPRLGDVAATDGELHATVCVGHERSTVHISVPAATRDARPALYAWLFYTNSGEIVDVAALPHRGVAYSGTVLLATSVNDLTHLDVDVCDSPAEEPTFSSIVRSRAAYNAQQARHLQATGNLGASARRGRARRAYQLVGDGDQAVKVAEMSEEMATPLRRYAWGGLGDTTG